MDGLRQTYGGNYRLQSPELYRWEAASAESIGAIALALTAHRPELASYLIAYYGAGRGRESWDAAVRLEEWLECSSKYICYC